MKIFINPDDKHILSATADKAILRGELRPEDSDDYVPCVLRVTRETYFAAINAWLDGKADYASRWNGEYCGVGDIIFEGTLDENYAAHLNLEGERTSVRTYTADDFSVDMEHG